VEAQVVWHGTAGVDSFIGIGSSMTTIRLGEEMIRPGARTGDDTSVVVRRE